MLVQLTCSRVAWPARFDYAGTVLDVPAKEGEQLIRDGAARVAPPVDNYNDEELQPIEFAAERVKPQARKRGRPRKNAND